MGLFDKISKLIFVEEDSQSNEEASTAQKKGSWTDIFFQEVSEQESNTKKKRSFSDLIFQEVSEQESDLKKKRRLSDLIFQDVPEDDINSTFVEGDVATLNDIPSQIEHRESELANLAEFLKTVNPLDYPDSSSEYEAYLSLVKQLEAIKEIISSRENSVMISMTNFQLESSFRKFELDYKAHIDSIKSLCYLSEVASLNAKMQELFASNFTSKTESKITQIERYINLISQKSDKFDKKYTARLYKALVEAEYRVTVLKLMNELNNGRDVRRNPFASFSAQKKKIFETYISRDIRDSSTKYNAIADGREKYIKYNLINGKFFDRLDNDAEAISEKINQYTIDDFLLTELFDNGDGFETLKSFLSFRLKLNFIDSKTQEAEARMLDDNYRRVTGLDETFKRISTPEDEDIDFE